MAESSDPYTYPGTDILRNIPDIQDAGILAVFEANATVARIGKPRRHPIAGKFNVPHLQAIHRYIFQDVFAWAGQFRTINISKGGRLFGAARFIEPALEDVLRKLASEKFLADLSLPAFARRAGHHLGEFNAVHPFREGNGRAQREFIRDPASRSDYRLGWTRIARQEMIDASIRGCLGDSSGLAELIERSAQPH